ncbi:lipoprotein signal peptidase [Aquabacterium lacunae]|uniref:Lipoprotein signal peptidase n=1 Tax=Aquabacterium lacunae TaxID=2528630 RepID=A0A4Q9H3Y4_9BURK|nr:signal peptidase II [Aquabacterium lacunae]TBO34311.1 lipoprotein signal peptidase [Aquabacterium lacunae]
MATKKAAGGAAGLWPWLGIALIIILLDQITKVVVIGAFNLYDSREVTSWFNLVRVHNHGAAFSFLANAGGWQRWFFTGLGVVAVGFIVWMLRQHGQQKRFAWALTLVMGGAVGNVIDRLIHGYVVDFLDFHWAFLAPMFPGGHFPAFNIADVAISLGAALLILDEIIRVRRG